VAAHAPARLKRAALLRGVYVIINEDDGVLELARAVLDGGVRIVQYRAKAGIVAENLRRLREITRECGALLIVNDDSRAAEEFDCDGVHLGPGDDGFATPATLRAAMRERLIGLSCGTLEEVRRAYPDDVDYLGIGSVYATSSKSDAGKPIGIEGLRRLASATTLPVAAVGGINLSTLPDMRDAGAAMAAIISATAQAAQPEQAARALVARWNQS
jgi:thiamine-phosphate pyrophosphorylase